MKKKTFQIVLILNFLRPFQQYLFFMLSSAGQTKHFGIQMKIETSQKHLP